MLYLLGRVASLLVYVLPSIEGNAVVLALLASLWQGILLWKGEPREMQASEKPAAQPGVA